MKNKMSKDEEELICNCNLCYFMRNYIILPIGYFISPLGYFILPIGYFISPLGYFIKQLCRICE
jgi:hypothetical protein